MTQLAGAAAVIAMGLLLSATVFLNELIGAANGKEEKDVLFQKIEYKQPRRCTQ